MKLWIILIIFLALIAADKTITAINIKTIEKYSPQHNKYSIEINPWARKFYVKFGLFWGGVLYGVISLATMLIPLLLFRRLLGDKTILYIYFLVFGLVIFNNLYWLLRYAKVIT